MKQKSDVTASPDLLKATEKGDVRRVKILLKHGVSPNCCSPISGYSPLQMSATRGYLEIVKALVKAGADIHYRGGDVPGTALSGAVIAGHTSIVRYLLGEGADPNEDLYPDGMPLIEEAKNAGYSKIVALLRKGR